MDYPEINPEEWCSIQVMFQRVRTGWVSYMGKVQQWENVNDSEWV